MAFAIVRSLLCLACLGLLIGLARRFTNRPIAINQELSAQSFNMYLVHFFPLVILQDMLMIWQGPAPIKIAVVAALTLIISYLAAKVIQRFPRGVSLFLVGLFVLKLVFSR